MDSKKIILITGANSGVGLDASYALTATSPNTHVILGCRSASKGTKALEELQARKPQGSLSLVELDITSDDSIASAAQKITQDFGVLDVLVNNAGIIVMQPTSRRAEFLDTFNTNAASAFLVTEALIPLLKKSKDPRIINVSSSLGSMTQRAKRGFSWDLPADAYRMSKAALNMGTASMYELYSTWENPPKVWSYCPGYVITNLSGEGDRQRREERGAESSETSAQGILEIVEGKRDAEAGLFVARRGERYGW